MFTVPDSSSPPSTPDARLAKQAASSNPFATSNPSTTPAGPPPTVFTAASTTPAGPPPSSVFGSRPYGSAIPFPSTSLTRDTTHNTPTRPRLPAPQDDLYDAMDEDQEMDSLLDSEDQVVASIEGLNVPAIAKALAIKPAALRESDDIILGTEHVVENVYSFVRGRQASAEEIDTALASATQELLKIWQSEPDARQKQLGIGPGDAASPIAKAGFLASLLLLFHHPSHKSATASFRSFRGDGQPKAIPEVLLDWLKDFHNQYPEEFEEVLNTEPNPTAHDRFWDVILSLTVRGNVSGASRLLKEADFREATSALDDGADSAGYRGKQLGNIQRVVNRAIAVLDSCPAVQSNDWNVKGSDWTIFRKRVSQALSDLEMFAEGSNAERGTGDEKAFEAENFGLSSVRSDDLSMSTMSRRAESRVPWSIYQNLNYMYAQLLGTRREIVAAAQDWVEATIALTVWWDGEQDDMTKSNLAGSRKSFGRSRGARPVDALPRIAYQQKLSLSLRQIMAENEDAELQVNTVSPVEVGLACIFEDDLEGVVRIIRGWSATISSAIVEVANLGSWLNATPSPSQALLDGFDQSDLLVLSFAEPMERIINPDDYLVAYANLLYKRADLQDLHAHKSSEGWELAIEVLGRVGNKSVADNRISDLLNQLDLTIGDRIEKVMGLCHRLNLSEVAIKMSDKYAEHLSSSTENYGGALYYYARAHNVPRIKDVVNVLTSSCVVSSCAYPPASDLDLTLNSILNKQKQTLAKLASVDREAAELLSAHISGYAMVRRFYDFRDQEVYASKDGHKPALRPMARKKAAVAALVAVITSASDSIHGGLHDAEVDSVVQVDVLLALLGEAVIFLNQPKRILLPSQIFTIMKAAEDLATSSSTVRAQCEECLKSALAHVHGNETPPLRSLLAKSVASNNRQVSLLGGSAGGGSGGLGGAGQRGWNWRVGMKRDASGEDVLQILRLGLARELSNVWVAGEV